MINNMVYGATLLSRGLNQLLQPGLKRFVFIPILVNIILFVVLTAYLIQHFGTIDHWIEDSMPASSWQSSWAWLDWIYSLFSGLIGFISAIFSGLIILLLILAYGFSFTLITNLIGAPFYGLLAEKIEQRQTGRTFPSESIASLITRTLQREMVKFWYFLSRGILVSIGLFLLSFVPLVNLIVPVLAILWAAWVMTLQYADYPADNNQTDFKSLRLKLGQRRWITSGFGGCIMLGTMVPLLNIFMMPIAVAGGTLLWVERLSD